VVNADSERVSKALSQNHYKPKAWNSIDGRHGEDAIRSLRGWFFVFDWVGAFCLRAEYFSMWLTLVGSQLL